MTGCVIHINESPDLNIEDIAIQKAVYKGRNHIICLFVACLNPA